MTGSFFARQLATYASYHRDARNRATHFIGIPAIVFSILVPLALVPIGKIGLSILICVMIFGAIPNLRFWLFGQLKLTYVPWLIFVVYVIYLAAAGSEPDAGVSWAAGIALLAVTGWILLDREIGVAMIAFMLPALIIAEWIARGSATTAWIVFAIFFIGGWAFQLVGHVWEGRRPALMDNLFQAFIGPTFIMAEVLIALGLKQDLKAVIDHAEAPAE